MVRTRIAPSPTGSPHIGTIYQAMINKAVAVKNKGKFYVRIEDTDQTRLVQGAEQQIYQALDWFGLTEDVSPRKPNREGPFRQSERLKEYQKYAQSLLNKNHAYYCFCTPERLQNMRQQQIKQKKPPLYDRHCLSLSQKQAEQRVNNGEKHVIRMKIPVNQTIIVKDLNRGQIKFDSNLIDHQVIIKSDGFPTYHLAVVVDDHLMKITHVIRGPEWLSSYPKHQLLYQYFDWIIPVIVHTPMITNMDGSKISKRHNHANVSWYQQQGYLPEAVLNFLALLGWSHPEGKEIFDFKEFVSHFKLKNLDPISPKFDLVKLEWINGEYIRKCPLTKLKEQIVDYTTSFQNLKLDENIVAQTIPLIQTRIKKLSDYWSLVQFIFQQPEKINYSLSFFKQVHKTLLKEYEQIKWKHENIYHKTESIAHQYQIKPIKLYMDLRYSLSNQKVTAPLFEGMELIGQKQTIKRLHQVIRKNF